MLGHVRSFQVIFENVRVAFILQNITPHLQQFSHTQLIPEVDFFINMSSCLTLLVMWETHHNIYLGFGQKKRKCTSLFGKTISGKLIFSRNENANSNSGQNRKMKMQAQKRKMTKSHQR